MGTRQPGLTISELSVKVTGFYVLVIFFIHSVSAFGLLKPHHEPKPGGLLDVLKPHHEPKPGGLLGVLKKPKLPGINVHLSKGGGGFGVGASVGSFGFGFGFGGHHVPPGTKVNLPPKDPQVPDEESYLPDSEPEFPDSIPEVPYPKPYPPEIPSEKGKEEKEHPLPTWDGYDEDDSKIDEEKEHSPPTWEGYDEDDSKMGSYGEDKGDPKRDSFVDHKEGRPAWEDIGETEHQNNPDSKSENFMNGDLVKEGIIQPRLKQNRNKRSIESHVYHVPLMFRSNAKPFQVKIERNPNSLMKEVSKK